MARYTESVCKLCRREGSKLFLKGDRCNSPKCAFERHPNPPGMHGKRRGKTSDYGVRLREKQKLKKYYGVLERQFRRYYEIAGRSEGNTGAKLLELFERRLDNVVYMCGWASSRSQARQLVLHGHIFVNGKRCNIASYLVVKNDQLKVRDHDKERKLVGPIIEANASRGVPGWIERPEADRMQAKILAMPSRDDVSIPVNEQLVVEFCSR